jgi:hypothetical protein
LLVSGAVVNQRFHGVASFWLPLMKHVSTTLI